MKNFKEGDVVNLNSGGPKMTICDIEDNFVSCCWFDKNDIIHSNGFSIEILTKGED